MKWHKFDKAKGYLQLRPPLRKWVVVQLEAKPPALLDLGVKLKEGLGLVGHLSPGIAVGYRKDAAGDKSCPYFVVPGIGGEVIAWCDCLPDPFIRPPEVGKGAESSPDKHEGPQLSPNESLSPTTEAGQP